ncbi:tRNA (guanine(26)-N(2)/guanine(27)-N(2))-dimethyltransferase [Halomicronema hongdechloris C2206]|uniref:tRNA (Guanine(26)-N(2)/guanine(27)-N(2))-dimethyltransferase n=1 Tax=Halomicronema hongdechloris C2206 TaxID=1641165 RepID=A0A1Z3HG65_9CYAN|nr:tRNA (guanine-N1)-methyltransferase [Halomicronema hongdechloris]ASC69282.1 tRNA (guanine(26)-N(2)/guanine(27)-N(2))-dimethyltransferase [Halomicronema hongdechloris C2206]
MSDWHQEGRSRFQVGDAFYRPHSRLARDLAVLAAACYRQQRGQLRVLDAMTGCGVRSLRYQQEAAADWIWANEGNPEVGDMLRQNLNRGLQPGSYRITHWEANRVFCRCYQEQDFYDLVDIDCFGSPTPYLSTGLWATRIGGLLYLTSTDGRTTSGREPSRSLAVYGAYARAHPAGHEQGLRLMIGATLQQAAAKGLSLEPVFSLFQGQVHRVMVRLRQRRWDGKGYGFIGYCPDCGEFQVVGWRRLSRARCPRCIERPLSLSGPQWLGPLHDVTTLQAMTALAQEWGWMSVAKMLEVMVAEATMPPYFFTLGEIGRRGALDIPPRAALIRGLCDRTFRATVTHLDPNAIKTDASLADCIAIARTCRTT